MNSTLFCMVRLIHPEELILNKNLSILGIFCNPCVTGSQWRPVNDRMTEYNKNLGREGRTVETRKEPQFRRTIFSDCRADHLRETESEERISVSINSGPLQEEGRIGRRSKLWSNHIPRFEGLSSLVLEFVSSRKKKLPCHLEALIIIKKKKT